MKPRTFDTLTKAAKWLAEHRRGHAVHLLVLHDDWCPSGAGGRGCTCTPHFLVEDLTPETLQRGQRDQQRWLSRHERN